MGSGHGRGRRRARGRRPHGHRLPGRARPRRVGGLAPGDQPGGSAPGVSGGRADQPHHDRRRGARAPARSATTPKSGGASCGSSRPTSRWPGRCSREVRLRPPRGVAIVHTEGFAERELAGMLAFLLRRDERPALLVEPAREEFRRPARARRRAGGEAAGRHPAGGRGDRRRARRCWPSSPRGCRRSRWWRRLPSPPAAAGAACRPRGGDHRRSAPRLQPPAGRRLLRSLGEREPEALYGYDAMRLVLDAIETGGPDRRKVVAAALRPRSRSGVTGRYAVRRDGAVAGRRLAVVDLGGTGFRRAARPPDRMSLPPAACVYCAGRSQPN